MISVIFPTFNEEGNVLSLHRQLVLVLDNFGQEYEIIAVDDGSRDSTVSLLHELSPLKIVVLAYNTGQSAALDAGIHQAKGDLLLIIDADLQNDPKDIPILLQKINEGYDAVVGWRQERFDRFGRRMFSRLANFIVRKLSGLEIHDYGCALRVFKRQDLEDIRLYGVMHIFIPIILAGRGAKIAEVPVRHHHRESGESKYSIFQMISNISDLLTIKFLYSHLRRPLVFFGKWSLVSILISLLICAWSITLKVKGVLGFSQTPLPILATVFLILGVLLFMLGFIAELLIRIYYESNSRSIYRILSVIDNKKE